MAWPFLTGSVNEFIAGAMIVVAIMIVYYILKFLGMLFSGGSSDASGFWRWIRRRVGRTGEVDFSSKISNLENLINQFKTGFNQFKVYCNDVLQTHNNFLNSIGGYGSPSPPVSPAQWQHVMDSASALASLRTRIDNLCSEIDHHRDFDRMSGVQRSEYTALLSEVANTYFEFNNFQIDFWDRYHRGDPPA